jgi:hypothetical protein
MKISRTMYFTISLFFPPIFVYTYWPKLLDFNSSAVKNSGCPKCAARNKKLGTAVFVLHDN